MILPLTKEAILSALVMAIRKDRANRYRLMHDWTLPRLTIDVPDFENSYFTIRDRVITVKAYAPGYESDGCTLSPDKIGNWFPVFGAFFHDPWYASIDEIAQAWGWKPSAVRKLGDELFACILVATGTPRWIARFYLTGLRAFGGIVRWFSATFALVLIALTLTAGCSGCAIPGYFDDKPITPPTYQEAKDGK